MSHNLLHQRFGSKEAIWRAAVDRGFGSLVAEIRAADDESAEPLKRLHTFVRTFVRFSAEHPELQRLMNIEGGQPGDRLNNISETFISPVMARFLPLSDARLESGDITLVPPEVIYYMITSGGTAMFANRALTERLFTGAPLAPSHIGEYADAVADLLMNALRP